MIYNVTFEKDALAAMIMNGLEAYVLTMGNKDQDDDSVEQRGHEVFAHIFGSIEKNEAKDRCDYSVEFINFDITARSTKKSVQPNPDALELKKEISKIMYGNKRELLGNFHTHPRWYAKPLAKYYNKKRWCPSEYDVDYGGENYQLDLIMAVMNAKRVLIAGRSFKDNHCVQFDLHNIRFCLAAYVWRYDEELDKISYVRPYSEVHLNQNIPLWKVTKTVDSSIRKRFKYKPSNKK